MEQRLWNFLICTVHHSPSWRNNRYSDYVDLAKLNSTDRARGHDCHRYIICSFGGTWHGSSSLFVDYVQ
jgi:hypothetical protein